MNDNPNSDDSGAVNPPEARYLAIDATCPVCGYPERRCRFDEHGPVFSCKVCPHISRVRDEPVITDPDIPEARRAMRDFLGKHETEMVVAIREAVRQADATAAVAETYRSDARTGAILLTGMLAQRAEREGGASMEVLAGLGTPVLGNAVMEALGLWEEGSR